MNEPQRNPYEDIVGVFEVAKELGVPISRVRRWIDRAETTRCPKPLKALQMGYLYSMTAWRDWHTIWRMTRASGRHKPLGTSDGVEVADGFIERLAARVEQGYET